MSKVKSFRKFALTLGTLGIGTIVTSAQPPEKGKPSVDPTTNARTVKTELKEAYKKWMNTDVAYIITKDEKRAFQALTTDEERENFIENFWRRRDPNPDTEEKRIPRTVLRADRICERAFLVRYPGMEDRSRSNLHCLG
jgi:GWxTD domain-containing protein